MALLNIFNPSLDVKKDINKYDKKLNINIIIKNVLNLHGHNYFNKCNDYLLENKKDIINW